MKKIDLAIIIILIFLCSQISLFGHDAWIDYEGTGNKVTIKIAGGHHFPRSDFLIKERLVRYCKVKTPGGNEKALTLSKKGNYHVATLAMNQKGDYIIYGGLRNPVRYFMKTIISHGKGGKVRALGEKYEIVPEKSPGDLKIGDRLKIAFLYQNNHVQTGISCTIDGKRNFSSFTNSKGIYSLRISRKGTYLLCSSYRGKTASLLFKVR